MGAEGRRRTSKDVLCFTTVPELVEGTHLWGFEVDAELVGDPLDDDGGQYDHARPQTQGLQLLAEGTAPVGQGFYRDTGTVGDLLTSHGLHGR